MIAAAFSVALSSGLSADEISILAGLFSAIGDNLALIAAKKDIANDINNENEND
jgi:hypothetical protein